MLLPPSAAMTATAVAAQGLIVRTCDLEPAEPRPVRHRAGADRIAPGHGSARGVRRSSSRSNTGALPAVTDGVAPTVRVRSDIVHRIGPRARERRNASTSSTCRPTPTAFRPPEAQISPASRYSTNDPATATFRLPQVPTIRDLHREESSPRCRPSAGTPLCSWPISTTVRRWAWRWQASGRPTEWPRQPDSTATMRLPAVRCASSQHSTSRPTQCTQLRWRDVLPLADASGTHGNRGTARQAPTASQIRSSVPRFVPGNGPTERRPGGPDISAAVAGAAAEIRCGCATDAIGAPAASSDGVADARQ